MLFGLGIEVDHLFGSKWLTNELFKLGFSISPTEITSFKHSVISHEEGSVETLLQGTFTQWVADNVDHNICTLDGKDTFHGMGIIAVGTKERHHTSVNPVCIKLNAKEVSFQKIPILWYEAPDIDSLFNIVFKAILELQSPTFFSTLGIDCLWHGSVLFDLGEIRPRWNGFMQKIQQKDIHPPKRDLFMLSIINKNHSGDNYIYSTLMFIEKQARKMNLPTPSVTFD